MCDLAEVYGITDLKGQSAYTLAALSCGLGHDSRTVRALSGQKLTVTETLLATIADRLGLLCWMQSEDGRKGRNKPSSILEALTEEKEEYSSIPLDKFMELHDELFGGV